jgi:signal transduction histidine kinase
MMDRLERSFDQATRFSADAAHELKTPLAVLQGEIEAALHAAPEGSAEQRAFGALLDEVQRLKAITEKLLLLSRADAGTLRLQRQPTDLSAAVRMMCEDAEVLAPEMEVTCEVAGGLQVHADPDLLDRVLHNLLSNAIKHNRPDGAVQITLTAEGGEARLTVANTGPEIPPDDRERIFDRFHRVDRSRDRRVEGAGLGLSLSREIVRAHDGDLTLVSSDRRQTVFALTLPLTGG